MALTLNYVLWPYDFAFFRDFLLPKPEQKSGSTLSLVSVLCHFLHYISRETWIAAYTKTKLLRDIVLQKQLQNDLLCFAEGLEDLAVEVARCVQQVLVPIPAGVGQLQGIFAL